MSYLRVVHCRVVQVKRELFSFFASFFLFSKEKKKRNSLWNRLAAVAMKESLHRLAAVPLPFQGRQCVKKDFRYHSFFYFHTFPASINIDAAWKQYHRHTNNDCPLQVIQSNQPWHKRNKCQENVEDQQCFVLFGRNRLRVIHRSQLFG